MNQIHCNAWFHYKNQTKNFCNEFLVEDDDEENSIASPSMDEEMEQPAVLPILADGKFDLN